jgi:hypothetical protein
MGLSFDAVPPETRSAIGAAWADMGRSEHASIASFAQHILDLTAVGAPPDLLAGATRALGDEIRHAERCFAVASAALGYPVGPGALKSEAPVVPSSEREILIATVHEGCIAETIAAAQMRAAAQGAHSPELRAIMSQIADDEERHAALAWRFVRWMLTRHPELIDAVTEAFEYRPSSAHDGLPCYPEWGILGASEQNQLAAQVIETVIEPCARALCTLDVASASPPA